MTVNVFSEREPLVISVGQFRPEKDHMLQLRAFKIFLDRYLSRNGQQAGGTRHSSPRLVLIGGCRNSEDLNRVEELRGASQALQLSVSVLSKPQCCNSSLFPMFFFGAACIVSNRVVRP